MDRLRNEGQAGMKRVEPSDSGTIGTEEKDQVNAKVSADILTHDRRILRSLRRIVRATDLYSRELRNRCGLTVPQLVCLSTIVKEKRITSVDLAHQVHLSPSTVVGILDRLEHAGHILRQRNSADRRQVYIRATDDGREAVLKAPSPLQDNLFRGLNCLPAKERVTIAESLERIVELMEAREVKVAPPLTLECKSHVGHPDRQPK